jgi:hypothetical protein
MHNALFIVSFAGGCGGTWLCHKYMEPWRLAVRMQDSPLARRVDMITAWALIAAFIIGCFGTEFILLWMHRF